MQLPLDEEQLVHDPVTLVLALRPLWDPIYEVVLVEHLAAISPRQLLAVELSHLPGMLLREGVLIFPLGVLTIELAVDVVLLDLEPPIVPSAAPLPQRPVSFPILIRCLKAGLELGYIARAIPWVRPLALDPVQLAVDPGLLRLQSTAAVPRLGDPVARALLEGHSAPHLAFFPEDLFSDEIVG